MPLVLPALAFVISATSAHGQQAAAARPAAPNVQVGQTDGLFTTSEMHDVR